jgi:hypothetical protein
VNQQELENTVIRILSGKQILCLDNNIYELRPASTDIKLEAALKYKIAYEDNLYSESFLGSDDIESMLYELGILYPQFSGDLVSIEKKIENSKVELFQNFFDRTKRQNIKKQLSSLVARYSQLLSSKHLLDFLTLENYCSNIKHAFIICNSLYHFHTDDLVFDINDIDNILFDNITAEISKNLLDLSQIKLVARSDCWRNYYTVNKLHLFPYSASELTEEQKGILSVSLMYDRIYEHPECPNKEIIDDDDALEGWMITQSRSNKQQKNEKGVNNMLTGKIGKANEVFLMANNQEQVQDIIGLNSIESANKLKQKMDTVLSAQGSIKDAQLPDVQQDLRTQLQKLNTKR